jgi:hypothetical protein
MNFASTKAFNIGSRGLIAFTFSAVLLFTWYTAPVSARASMCDRKWVSCNNSRCTGTKCMQKCDQQYSKCRSGPFAD